MGLMSAFGTHPPLARARGLETGPEPPPESGNHKLGVRPRSLGLQDEATRLANACTEYEERLVIWTLPDTGMRLAEFLSLM